MSTTINVPLINHLFETSQDERTLISARHLKSITNLLRPVDVSYDYVVDQQPIGKVLFGQFCESKRPEFYKYVTFLENASR